MKDPSKTIHPDPIELQRRIDEDKWVVQHVTRISELEALQRRRFQESVEAAKPLREENGRISNERARLLKVMKVNDSKIRTIRERAMVQYQPELKEARLKLRGRKNSIKDRYVKQLMCIAREELNRALPLSPLPGPITTPTP